MGQILLLYWDCPLLKCNVNTEYVDTICYDSIVGAVVASRLSEMENWNVLLLEAGGDETEISDVPLMAAYLQLSQLDWKYKSEPQGNACLGKKLQFIILYLTKKIYIYR